jgi:hypothetical protein
VQRDVQRLGLQDVLSSFPIPDSFHFNKARKNGHDTIMLFLGNRPSLNGSTSQARARIVSQSERKDLRPPLLFYDHELNGTRTIQYPRSASSLLRKATLLLPPFCFLQHDLIDEATNVREMLSAIILYLAAATEVDASAWRWDKFGDSLIHALRYIDTRSAFHEWRHRHKLAALAQSDTVEDVEKAQAGLGQDTHASQPRNPATEDSNTVSATPKGQYLGGTVRSRGSYIAITANTSLEKLKKELGDRKFRMLDQIPPKPMTISQHDIGGTLFPFRMFVGTAVYQETGELINIYAYIDYDEGKTSMYFMSHDKTGLEQIYDVNDMREGVDLVQPLEYLNNLKKVSYKNDAKSARTAKLRSLVSYYFFLAENQGLISSPGIDVHEAFGKRLCAVCKELGMGKWGNDDDGGSGEGQDEHRKDAGVDRETRSITRRAHKPAITDTMGSPEEEIDTESPRGVRLRTQSAVPSDIVKSKSIEQNEDMPDQDSPTHQVSSTNIADTTTLELELRPSSQNAHEDPPGLSGSELMDTSNSPSHIEPAKAGLSVEQTMRSRSPRTSAALDLSGYKRSTALPALLVSTPNTAAEIAHSGSVHARASAAIDTDRENTSHVSVNRKFLVDAADLRSRKPPVRAEVISTFDASSEDLRRLVTRNESTFGNLRQIAEETVDSRSPVGATALVNTRRHVKSEDGGIDLDQFVSRSISYVRSVGSRYGRDVAPATDSAEDVEIGVKDTLDWALFGREACFPSNTRPPMTGFLFDPLSVHRTTTARAKSEQIQIPQPNDDQVEEGSEHVSSLPAPTPTAFLVSSIDAKKSITVCIDNDLQLNRSVQNLLAAQIGGNRPLTPEGSAERDLKSQAESTEPARTAPQAPSALEAIFISDDEDEHLVLPAPRSVIDRTPEARNCVRQTIVDLTQLSSSPRGKKRKSLGPIYLFDSENDVIAMTDGSEWRQKSRGRQK